jgi:hypothetical protein
MVDNPFPPTKIGEEPVLPKVVEAPVVEVKEEPEYVKILKEYGQESNIPINHRYWKIRP